MRKILVLFLLFACFIPSIRGFAQADLNPSLDELKQICDYNVEQRKAEVAKIKEGDNKTIRISEMFGFANSLRNECIKNESEAFRDGDQNRQDYDKSKRFLEIIGPIQSYFQTAPSPQFKAIGIGIMVSTVIQQLNRLISPDNWACLPQIVKTPLDKAFDNFRNLGCKPLISLDLSPVVESVENVIYSLGAVYILWFIIVAWTAENRIKKFRDLVIPHVLKLLLITAIPTLFLIVVMTSNTVTNLAFNVFNNTDQICELDSGFACISDKMARSIQMDDFVRMSPGMLDEPKEDKNFIQQFTDNWNNDDAVSMFGWGFYYLIIFIVIGIIGLWVGCIFASSQIIIWAKLIIIMLSLYTITLLPNAGIKDKFEEITKLLLSSLANIGIYNLLLFITITWTKDGVNFGKILGLLFLVASYTTISAYFFGLLNIRMEKGKIKFSTASPTSIARGVVQTGLNVEKGIRNRYKQNEKVFGNAKARIGKIAGKLRFGGKK